MRSMVCSRLALIAACTSILGTDAIAQVGSLDQPIVFPTGTFEVGGWVQASRFEVAEGSTLVATEDLFLECEGPIVIDGTLLALSGQPRAGNLNAVNIALVSGTAIIISGDFIAGDGADGSFAGQIGGAGTSIYLEAPTVLFQTDIVRAGDGGRGGKSARGGNGGDVYVAGTYVTSARPEFAGVGGNGGPGGFAFESPDPRWRGGGGGDGGRGGDATVAALPRGLDLSRRGNPRAPGDDGDDGGDKTGTPGGQGTPHQILCTPGGLGSDGTAMIGGNGGDGENGLNGTATTNGGPGGKGGRGGHGTGGAGGPGGDGGACCTGNGRCGGEGGKGAKGTGGFGGNGGRGGEGGKVDLVYVTAGGPGGNGGNGGDGNGGVGGKGGDAGAYKSPGGAGCILVAAGGAGGDSACPQAAPGTGGNGGNGTTNGTRGQDGNPGTANDGGQGANGNLANPCSQQGPQP